MKYKVGSKFKLITVLLCCLSVLFSSQAFAGFVSGEAASFFYAGDENESVKADGTSTLIMPNTADAENGEGENGDVETGETEEVTETAEDEQKPEVMVCKTASDTVNAIFEGGYTGGEIHIAKNAELTVNGKGRDVYFVSLMGLGGDQEKTNNYVSCVKSAFNLKSSYFKRVKAFMLENIPEGTALVFCGHSLGGMTLQQLRADEEITEKYEIIATLTAGSPFIMTKKDNREGSLVRISDKADLVPYLSPAILFSRKNHKDRVILDGGYDKDHDSAHNKCYRRADLWADYDALGVFGGDAVLSFPNSDVITLSA